MKNGKILILLMTAVCLLLILGIGCMEPVPEPETQVNMPLSVSVTMDGQQENLRCWQDEKGDYVVFLPAGVGMSDVVLSPEEGIRVTLEQTLLEKAWSCGHLQPETPYFLSCGTEGIVTEHTLTFLRSGQVPSLHLDVQSGSMQMIHATKGNQESGHARMYTPAGALAWSGLVESIRGRGNTTWLQEKKPYSITLAGEADLLGMGKAKEWILLANALDPSHLRNKAVYDLAAKAGMSYTPDCRWVDLYLNGDYAGLYLLSERNEIQPNRVGLQEAGSFLVCREMEWRLISQNQPHITLDSGAALRIHDSGVTKADLRRIWQPVDNAILSEDGIDPITGSAWQELIDLDSWVMAYLTGEIFGNVDAGIVSEFFYRDGTDPSGKIYSGPIWDYDLTMGSKSAWQAEYVQAYFVDRAHIQNFEDTTWAYWLNRKPEFQDRVKELYQTVYRPLVQALLDTGLEDYAAQIRQSAALDQRRWGTVSAAEETAAIHRYMTERLAFLDSAWLEDTRYCRVLVMPGDFSSAFNHAVLPGERIPALPEYEESWDILGWYDASTEQPFDPSAPIYQDMIVYLKKLPAEEDEISVLQAVPIVAVAGILVGMILTERNRCRKQRETGERTVARRKIT